MLFELLATDMYVSYNVKLAKTLGLTSAIYLSELININRKAIEKNKIKDGYFKINREYIEDRTTINKADQKDLDKLLSEVKAISIGENSDMLKVDMDVLTSLILGDQKIVAELPNSSKRGRPTKQEIIVRALKANIETNNPELKKAYEDWIDAVNAKNGWMTKVHVLEGQKVIDTYTNKDLDMALEIVKIATLGGYRDMNWATAEFEKKYKKEFNSKYSDPVSNPVQKPRLRMSEEVF